MIKRTSSLTHKSIYLENAESNKVAVTATTTAFSSVIFMCTLNKKKKKKQQNGKISLSFNSIPTVCVETIWFHVCHIHFWSQNYFKITALPVKLKFIGPKLTMYSEQYCDFHIWLLVLSIKSFTKMFWKECGFFFLGKWWL